MRENRSRVNANITGSRRSRLAVFLLAVAAAVSAAPPSSAWAQKVARGATEKAKARSTLVDAGFRSESLQREMHYRVLLPAGYESSEKRYPTLYLLHGLYGDFKNWSTLTHLADWAERLDLVVAMPDAGNSWYVNSATKESDRFEDYIVNDFIAEVDSHFRTIRDRRARAIAGLSMGGYAAMNFSIKHSTLFSYSGVISGALDAPSGLDERISEFREGLQNAFGPHGNPNRSANDVFLLLETSDKSKLPYFYIDCGEDDIFSGVNRNLATRLQEKHISYEYHEMPGAHTWEYWDCAIRRFLVVLCSKNFVHRSYLPECDCAT